jgi:hypothetical protein
VARLLHCGLLINSEAIAIRFLWQPQEPLYAVAGRMSVKPTRSTNSRETLYEIAFRRNNSKQVSSSKWGSSHSVASRKLHISFLRNQKGNSKALSKKPRIF